MLLGIKRWWSPPAAPIQPAWRSAQDWAQHQGHVFRSVPEAGFVMEGQLRAPPAAAKPPTRAGAAAAAVWRLEWGPSKRHYIVAQELRLQSELPLDPDLQLLVINRCLKNEMERSVFELFVEGVQTRIDTATPPEMRWLVLLPAVDPSELPGLGTGWAAVASHKQALLQWAEGAMLSALAAYIEDPLRPVVLMISRGRLSLRAELAESDLHGLPQWVSLFEAALHAALALGPRSQTARRATSAPGEPSLLRLSPTSQSEPVA